MEVSIHFFGVVESIPISYCGWVGISFRELAAWIKDKAQKEGGNGPWSHMLSTPDVLSMAHALSGRNHKMIAVTHSNRIVNLNDFRSLLINLYAMSILFVHFKHADQWLEGNDFGNMTLSFDEFKMACRSISAAHAHETISDEQLRDDFDMLDTNQSNSLAFLEVGVMTACPSLR
jgi:hypothetical protein